MKIPHLLSTLLIASSLACAQSVPFGPATDNLYLLAATPSANFNAAYGAELYRFGAAGHLVLVREIIDTNSSKKEIERGIRFVLADYESRVLVIGSPNLGMKRLDMVLMDSPAAPASRVVEPPAINGSPWVPWSRPHTPRDPRASPTSMIGANLIDNNSGVKSIVLHYASDRGLVRVAIPFTSVGFGVQKFIPDSDMASLRVFGNFGIARLGYSDQSSGRTERGRVLYPSNPVDYDLGLPAPPTLDGPKSSNRWLMVHNKQMSVLWDSSAPKGLEESVLHVWTPSSAKWTQFRVPGSPPECKAIGSWILGLVSTPANGRTSPGQAARQKRADNANNGVIKGGKGKPPQLRPGTEEWFQASDKYYPGTLFAIDTTNGKMITWQTGQGDSEILLVRGDTFIYRVNDTLYSARIQGTSVGTPQLLAQDEAIPDMHWAFTSRQ